MRFGGAIREYLGKKQQRRYSMTDSKTNAPIFFPPEAQNLEQGKQDSEDWREKDRNKAMRGDYTQ